MRDSRSARPTCGRRFASTPLWVSTMHAAAASSPRGRPAFPRRCSPSTRTSATWTACARRRERGKALGFFGRSVIHPAQVGTINDVFTPTEGELRAARELTAALDDALLGDVGAVALPDGRFVDRAVAEQARETVATRRAPRRDDGRERPPRGARTRRGGVRPRAAARSGDPGLAQPSRLPDGAAAPARRQRPPRRQLRRERDHRHGRPRRHPRRRARPRVVARSRCTAGASASEAQRGGRFSVQRHRDDGSGRVPRRAPRRARRARHGRPRARRASQCGRPATGPRAERASRSGPAMPSSSAPAGPVTGAIPPTFVGQERGAPGPDESAARWLAERRVALTGGETVAYEQIPPGQGHALLPVHVLLLVEHGIHIVEMLDLERLAAQRRSRVPLRARAAEDRRRHRLAGPSARRRLAMSPTLVESARRVRRSLPRARSPAGGLGRREAPPARPGRQRARRPRRSRWRRLCDRSLSAGAGPAKRA